MPGKINRAVICWLVIILCTGVLHARPAANRVAVVVGKNAPDLEKFAASELCGYLNKLFGLDVQPTNAPAASASAVFLIGTPASNPLIKALPKVGEQGIVIQRAEGRDAHTHRRRGEFSSYALGGV